MCLRPDFFLVYLYFKKSSRQLGRHLMKYLPKCGKKSAVWMLFGSLPQLNINMHENPIEIAHFLNI